MKVLKFGGSSLASAESIRHVSHIIAKDKNRGEIRAVVVSASGKSTDQLQSMAQKASVGKDSYQTALSAFQKHHDQLISELLPKSAQVPLRNKFALLSKTLSNLLYGILLVREVSPRTMDYVLSFGERYSALLLTTYLKSRKIKVDSLDAREIIKTDKRFGSARVDKRMTTRMIKEHFTKNKRLQIVTGFISSAKGGLTTTLGRGGSDYTTSIIGASLGVDMIEIWTDVDGVLTSDPRKVEKALTIPQMTYAEAVEMSHFGAKVIYPPTMLPALEKRIPINIRNTFNPEHTGTLISGEASQDKRAVKGISSISSLTLLTLHGSGLFGVPGIAQRLFASLAASRINIILITQGSSENSISLAIEPRHYRAAVKAINTEFEYEMKTGSVNPVKVEAGVSSIAIIGENMRLTPGIAGKMLTALGNNGINVVAIAQGSSELNISVVIAKEHETKALNVLHEAFFLSPTKVLHLFMVGVGLIGGTLLKQLQEQTTFLKEKRSLEIRVVALANSKKMLFDYRGIGLKIWPRKLASGQPTNIATFVENMIEMNMSNSIFIDNTADLVIPDQYSRILDASISISTPNKVATSSNFNHYLDLLGKAEENNVYFGYETNVGAGLPVISTLRNLVDSGDRIRKIEGVLSGSLSFIFNHFDEQTSFSEAVKQAGELGYTEPDPRVDLNGLDVKRKILILAREAGLAMEADHISVENILPEYCQKAKQGADLNRQLKKADVHFEEIRQAAEAKGKKLRMIAKLARGKATIRLESVGKESPFYFLSGSDNMLVFTTDRYDNRPLVIQGPGAGAEVTAAGVFAEIIHIGNLL